MAVNSKLVLVAPLMSVKVAPPSVLSCHCMVGAGIPLAVATKPAVAFSHTVRLEGSVATEVATFTVIIAAVVIAVPHELVNTARY